MKVEAVLGFKPEAIKALCKLCQSRVEALKPGRDNDDEEGNGGDEEEEKAGEDGGDQIGGGTSTRIGQSIGWYHLSRHRI
jgi:hypothetical protein